MIGYIIYLIVIMVVVGFVKEYNLFGGLYKWLNRNVSNKKFLIILISSISGVLPIPGRCMVSAAMFDTVATVDKKRRGRYGILDYLCTHHYYFWSPLEQTVIIPMAVLSLSYTQFLSYVWPLLLGYLICVISYIVFFIRNEDIVVCLEPPKPIKFNFRKVVSYINWRLILVVIGVMVISIYCKDYVSPLVKELGTNSIIIASLLGTSFAFAMGSSSKFAGIVAILCSAFGTQFLPLFFASEFTGYLLSPTHKCVVISKMYFGTSIRDFYLIMLIVCFVVWHIGLFCSIV